MSRPLTYACQNSIDLTYFVLKGLFLANGLRDGTEPFCRLRMFPMNASLASEIKAEALRLGFQLVGVCPAVDAQGVTHLAEWLEAGYAGEMQYLAARQAAYAHPKHVLDGVRSVVMLGMNYATAEPRMPEPGEGRVARYAWGTVDYHDLIHARLDELKNFVQQQAPAALVRGVVDTAPLLEREFAQLAGLGWVGKHTLLINRQVGSWFFLAALLTDLEVTPDVPFTADHCGSCRACLDACPTDAFPQPYVLDASRCISYLTIELKGSMPEELRAGVGDWLFGCDICQEVCPWNRRAPLSQEPGFQPQPELNPVDAAELLKLDEAAFRARFRHTPFWRPKRRGLLRNAAIVLGNNRSERAFQALLLGLQDHEPLVRAACVWALAQYRSEQPNVPLILQDMRVNETDTEVLAELSAVLSWL